MEQQEWLMEKNDNIFATRDMEGTIFKKSKTKNSHFPQHKKQTKLKSLSIG
jgi:hypothetical protein